MRKYSPTSLIDAAIDARILQIILLAAVHSLRYPSVLLLNGTTVVKKGSDGKHKGSRRASRWLIIAGFCDNLIRTTRLA
jgi:hypothetical protein